MSNRRLGKKRRRVRAPRDPAEVFETETEARGPRGWLDLTAAGLKALLGILVIAATVGGLSWGVVHYAKTTPRFGVKTIEVDGTERLSREDVLAASRVELGQNLFLLQLDQIESHLVQSPWIRAAHVVRRLPQTLTISIEERAARAVALIAGKAFLMDDEGVPFKPLGKGDPHDLPLVTGIEVDKLIDDPVVERERVADALRLLAAYEKLPVARQQPAQEVHLSATGHATLTVGHQGTALHLGQQPWRQKLLRGARILGKTRQQGAEPRVIFLDNEAHPERVVVRVQ